MNDLSQTTHDQLSNSIFSLYTDLWDPLSVKVEKMKIGSSIFVPSAKMAARVDVCFRPEIFFSRTDISMVTLDCIFFFYLPMRD